MWGTQIRIYSNIELFRFIPTHVGNTLCITGKRKSHSVHPHACGEHIAWRDNQMKIAGSSPRMWGTHLTYRLTGQFRRFIPTHVGNTRSHPGGGESGTVHPHACGEHITGSAEITAILGSSPRVWGTHHRIGRDHRYPRFIPTHVGNTLHARCSFTLTAVHPHACGEH